MTPYTECENCGSIWSIGTEEYDWQQCSACAWRPGQPIDDEDESELYNTDYDNDEDEDERNDPNDSRNL